MPTSPAAARNGTSRSARSAVDSIRIEELFRVAYAVAQTFERVHDAFECLTFFAEVLRALRVAPDIGIFGELSDFA